tara:strand:+ start:4452 stop:4757 length:306 start_codon:yes stop_codon:yes gene_type:complete
MTEETKKITTISGIELEVPEWIYTHCIVPMLSMGTQFESWKEFHDDDEGIHIVTFGIVKTTNIPSKDIGRVAEGLYDDQQPEPMWNIVNGTDIVFYIHYYG